MYSNLEIKKDSIVVNTGDAEFHPNTVVINGRNYFKAFNERDLPPRPKERIPLFVTEDGYDIYEGGSVFVVTTVFEILTKYNMTKVQYDSLKACSVVFFNKMEEAIDYKRMNEPIYSANDVTELAKCGAWNERIRLHLINAIEDYKKSTKQ